MKDRKILEVEKQVASIILPIVKMKHFDDHCEYLRRL